MLISDIVWGDDSAEKDPNLEKYFIESPAFDRIKNKTKNLVIGRKGAGKSAFRELAYKYFSQQINHNVINIAPNFNTLRSILNDKEISDSFGKEIFFQHTWLRKILLDCLCTIGDDQKGKFAKESFEFARNLSIENNKTNRDLAENVSWILQRIKIKAGKLDDLGINIEKALTEASETDSLIFHFNEIIRHDINFAILIDDLDLGWDNSNIANNLLLGLLSAVNTLLSLGDKVYICVFLREDVYNILMEKTQHSDKYRNIQPIRWKKEGLISLLNERINFNRDKNGLVKLENPFNTVFPEMLGTSNTDNWLFERTLSRPRELIQLVRYYSEALDDEKPSDEELKNSEKDYSEWKLSDLCTEYSNQYPNLSTIFSYWKSAHFRSKYHLNREEIDEILLDIMINAEINTDWFNDICKDSDVDKFLDILYEIGFIGDYIKGGDGGSTTYYSYQSKHEPIFNEIQIHPCFRPAINTVKRIRSKK